MRQRFPMQQTLEDRDLKWEDVDYFCHYPNAVQALFLLLYLSVTPPKPAPFLLASSCGYTQVKYLE